MCVLQDGFWYRLDGNGPLPFVIIEAEEAFDLAGYYERLGCVVVRTSQRDRPVRSPMVHANCVGAVKFFLCIRAPLALTPWRLFRHLTKDLP